MNVQLLHNILKTNQLTH